MCFSKGVVLYEIYFFPQLPLLHYKLFSFIWSKCFLPYCGFNKCSLEQKSSKTGNSFSH